ncbi:MAG: FAD-binding oxidoreductase, partial [Pseudonocardiaceae bacterium]
MVAPTLGGLRAACADVVQACADDTVDGVPACWVAWPRSTEEVSAVLRAAAGLGLRVVARGTGTRLSWGVPPTDLDLIVDTSRMAAVLAHVAGDLVVTTQAGLQMVDLQNVLARYRQRLALDSAGTVGGTIATAASGPLRYRYGSVRDLLIGITVVLADGTVTRSGGTVVKNVAGYDLGKLYTGSLGTLGVITEAVFRLHPLPEASRWITVPAPDAPRAAAAVAAVRASQ